MNKNKGFKGIYMSVHLIFQAYAWSFIEWKFRYTILLGSHLTIKVNYRFWNSFRRCILVVLCVCGLLWIVRHLGTEMEAILISYAWNIRGTLEIHARLIFHKIKDQAYCLSWVPFDLDNMSSKLEPQNEVFHRGWGSFMSQHRVEGQLGTSHSGTPERPGVLCIFQKFRRIVHFLEIQQPFFWIFGPSPRVHWPWDFSGGWVATLESSISKPSLWRSSATLIWIFSKGWVLCIQHSFDSEGQTMGPISLNLKMRWVPNLVGRLRGKVCIFSSNFTLRFNIHTKLCYKQGK